MVTPRHIARLFTAHVEVSPCSYVAAVRAALAEQSMRAGQGRKLALADAEVQRDRQGRRMRPLRQSGHSGQPGRSGQLRQVGQVGAVSAPALPHVEEVDTLPGRRTRR